VGFVVAAIIVAAALGAVSEIVLPLTFAAVLAVIFKPAVAVLERHRVKPTLAAGLIVLGLLALMTAVIAATVRGITDQTDEIGDSVDKAIGNASTPSASIRPPSTAPGRPSRKRRRPSPAASSPICCPASTRWSASPVA
jgi:predicted PurR-regulated permease PerM